MKSKRLQIDVSEESFKRLQDLKNKSEASSYAEVTSKAYKVYEFLVNAQADGKKIILGNPDGTQTEVEFI